MYSVKEMYYTLQGEGNHTGRAAIFLRFAGCNLWNGKETGREVAVCKFCDTDFIGTDGENGGKFTAQELAMKAREIWDQGCSHPATSHPMIVCTGGEPLLQLDRDLILALKVRGFFVAVETNGTLPAPKELDWVCVSPKADAPLKQTSGNEIKLVYPQVENKPSDFEDLEFDHFFIQPLDDDQGIHSSDPFWPIQQAVDFCMSNPKWRLSLQTHKLLNIK